MRAPDPFRDAMARWASSVTIVAVRSGKTDRGVHATTVTSFAPVSIDPPQIVVSLNPNAQVLPFVQEGTEIGVSLLSEEQRRWGRMFSDPFPAGPDPWPEEGAPLIPDASVGLACTVSAVHPTPGDSRLVLARVDEIRPGGLHRPLLYWQRGYVRLEEE